MDTGKGLRVLAGGAVVLIAVLTFRQAVAISETASANAAEASTALEAPGLSQASPGAIRPSAFRTPPDVCFDVPLNEAASCRGEDARKAYPPADSSRLPPDVCFDVPLREPCDE